MKPVRSILLAGDLEIGQTGGERVTSLSGRDIRYLGRSRRFNHGNLSGILGINFQPVSEVAEAEVGEQLRAQRISESRRNALVPGQGYSREFGRVDPKTACAPKRG